MSISPLIFNGNGTPGAVSTDDTNKVSLRKLTTAPLTHDDLDDNFQSISEKINDLVGAVVPLFSNWDTANPANPTQQLTLQGYPALKVLSNDGLSKYQFYPHDNGYLYINDETQTRVAISDAGYVGIGTGTPDNPLEVQTVGGKYALSACDHLNQLGGLYVSDNSGSGGLDLYLKDRTAGTTKSLIASTPNLDSYFNNGGKVGIGTASPDRNLTVAGNFRLEKTEVDGGHPALDFNSGGAADHPELNIYDKDGNAGAFILSGGNVGIGTTPSSTARLVLQDTTNGWVGLGIRGSAVGSNAHYEDNDWVMYASRGSAPTDKHFFGIYNADANDGATAGYKFAVTKQGNVGIGTAQPIYKLNIEDDGDTFVGITAGADNRAAILFGDDANKSIGRITYDNSTDAMHFGTDATTPIKQKRMTIDSGGKVGIGTNQPGEKLEVAGNGAHTVLKIHEEAGTHDATMKLRRGTSDWEIGMRGSADLRFNFENDTKLYLDANGNVGIGADASGNQAVTLEPGVATNSYSKVFASSYLNLSLGSGSGAEPRIYLRGSATGVTTAGDIYLASAQAANCLVVQAATGYVGIGTNQPSTRLTVKGSDPGTNSAIIENDHLEGYGLKTIGGGNTTARYLADFRDKDGVSGLKIDGDRNVDIGGNLDVGGIISGDASGLTNLPSSGAPSGDFTGTLRGLAGAHTPPTSGKGIEIFHNSTGTGKGYVFAYDRDTTAYGDTQLGGSPNGGVTVLGSNGNVGIGTTIPDAPLHIKTSNTSDTLLLESTGDSEFNAPDLILYRNSSTPADADNLGIIKFRGVNDGTVGVNRSDIDYALIQSEIVDASNNAEKGSLSFWTRGVGSVDKRMTIDSTGNVGIGTTSPSSYKLNVNGTVHLGKLGSATQTHIIRSGGGVTGNLENGLKFIPGAAPVTDQYISFYTGTSTPVHIGSFGSVGDTLSVKTRDTSNALNILQNGDVGIGTDQPSEKLHIRGSNPAIKLEDSDGSDQYSIIKNANGDTIYDAVNGTSGWFGNPAPGAHIFRAPGHSDNEKMRIASDGNVGIGTDQPDGKLTVATTSDETNTTFGNLADSLVLHNTSDVVGAGPKLVFYNSNNPGSPSSAPSALIGLQRVNNSDNQGELVFWTRAAGDPLERMRINSDGNVGIGTNDPDWSLDIETPDGGVQFQLGRIAGSGDPTGAYSGSAWMGADVNGFHLGVGEYNNGGGTVGTPNGITVTDAGKLKLSSNCPDAEAAITDKVTYGGTAVNSIDFTINGTTLEITTS